MNLLQYLPGNSILHRLNPVAKLAAAFLLGICAIVSQSVIFTTLLIILLLGICFICGLGKRALGLTRSLLVLGGMMFVLQLFFVRSGDPLLSAGKFTLITQDGLSSAVLLGLRIIATMLPLMLLFAITEMNDLCGALVKRLHVPYRYAFIVTTAFRFVPLFTAEFHDIEDAQKARGVEYDGGLIKKLKLSVPLFVPLLMSSLKKVDSGAMSAQLRGFNLRTVSSGYREYPFTAADIGCVLLSVLMIAAAAIV